MVIISLVLDDWSPWRPGELGRARGAEGLAAAEGGEKIRPS